MFVLACCVRLLSLRHVLFTSYFLPLSCRGNRESINTLLYMKSLVSNDLCGNTTAPTFFLSRKTWDFSGICLKWLTAMDGLLRFVLRKDAAGSPTSRQTVVYPHFLLHGRACQTRSFVSKRRSKRTEEQDRDNKHSAGTVKCPHQHINSATAKSTTLRENTRLYRT